MGVWQRRSWLQGDPGTHTKGRYEEFGGCILWAVSIGKAISEIVYDCMYSVIQIFLVIFLFHCKGTFNSFIYCLPCLSSKTGAHLLGSKPWGLRRDGFPLGPTSQACFILPLPWTCCLGFPAEVLGKRLLFSHLTSAFSSRVKGIDAKTVIPEQVFVHNAPGRSSRQTRVRLGLIPGLLGCDQSHNLQVLGPVPLVLCVTQHSGHY